MPSLLDRQLERGLGQVAAPDELWTRVDRAWQAKVSTREPRKRAKWPLVAAAALAACGLAAAVLTPPSTSYSATERRQARFAQPATASESNFSCSLCHVD